MNPIQFTLDTTVLVDANDFADPLRQSIAEAFVRDAATAGCLLTLQAIGEFYFVVTRKRYATPALAASRARLFMTTFPLVPPTSNALDRALDAAEKGRFAFWDAYMLAAASDAGCTICFSSDMHDGAKLGPITVRRPYDARGLSKIAQAVLAP